MGLNGGFPRLQIKSVKFETIIYFGIGLALFYLYKQQAGNGEGGADQLPNFAEAGYYDMTQPALNADNPNRAAFLALLKHAEGTDLYENPYLVIFGGLESPYGYQNHPGNLGFTDWAHFTDSTGKDNWSTCSGAYQFKLATWNELAQKLGLFDFTPANQDAAALELLRMHGALSLIDAGDIAGAIDKVRRVWASLPGAGYNQPEKPLAALLSFYNAQMA